MAAGVTIRCIPGNYLVTKIDRLYFNYIYYNNNIIFYRYYIYKHVFYILLPSLSEVSDEMLLSFAFKLRLPEEEPACCKCCRPVNKLFSIIARLSSS